MMWYQRNSSSAVSTAFFNFTRTKLDYSIIDVCHYYAI